MALIIVFFQGRKMMFLFVLQCEMKMMMMIQNVFVAAEGSG